MSKVALVDGSNLIFRSYFAVKPLSTSSGIPTNAVYGSLKSFRSVINELKPDFCVVIWDSGKKSFRNDIDVNYKAHRPPVDDALKSQFKIVQKAFEILGVPQITAPPGAECDDLIGTIAVKASDAGIDSVIVSSDKDFYQLCNDHIKVWSFTLAKKQASGLVDADYVRKEFGVEPNQLTCIKSLTGEKTDNIQGVKGIGPVTATALIKQHGNVHNLLKYLETNPGHKNYTIYENKDIVELALKLAIINTNVEIEDVPIRPVDKIKIDRESLKQFFEALEMNSFLSEFNQWSNLFGYKTSVS